MFFMDPKLALFVVGLTLISGCLLFEIIEEKTRVDPADGDLSLLISMDHDEYDIRPESMVLAIVLKNDCDHRVWMEDAFDLGWTLYPNITPINGSRVQLAHPLVDYLTSYSCFDPGDTKTVTIDLTGMVHSIEIDG